MIQKYSELNKFHEVSDPWAYEQTEGDKKRKQILLSEIPSKKFLNVLDIGCGQGFVTRDLPGAKVLGLDISENAIAHAKKYESDRMAFKSGSVFELNNLLKDEKFDLVIITGVLYPQYIGRSEVLVYDQVDKVLSPDGILISVHIDSWYSARFPYLLNKQVFYEYREYTHCLEVYYK